MIINDFSITVGTKNGSGSQTSNLTIMRALFRMGIPVSGKNLFPSNIQGLPTWYTIRVSKDGYLARRETQEIVIAMNPDSFAKDLASVTPGGLFLYGDHIKMDVNRSDILAHDFPAVRLARESEAAPSLRDYIANMAYVGVLAQLIGIDFDAIYKALMFHFKNKTKPADLNFSVIKAAAEWTAENIKQPSPYRVKPMDATGGYIMADGNTAAALGSIYGGVQLVTWYPITPASSLGEQLNAYLPTLRKDPDTGKHTFAVVQTEDELAAIGMAVGGGWAGLRAMTSTSGPGISLMTEFTGLAYFTETPVVVWDVQRMGPSTGLPTRTSQGDLTAIYNLGHGDTQNILLLPGSVTECFEFGWRALDIAELIQTPVFVLSDLDLGMNTWMTKPFAYPDQPIQRGKILWEEGLEKLTGRYGRYLDVDGDGIPYRTVPGNRHPASAWFARGTGHDPYTKYTEDPVEWDQNLKRLMRKYDNACQYLPKPEIHERGTRAVGQKERVGIIAFGSTDSAVLEACDQLAEQGIQANYLRLRSIPFVEEVGQFISKQDRIYIVEMNHTGQLHQILNINFPGEALKFKSITYNTGLPLTAKYISDSILAQEVK